MSVKLDLQRILAALAEMHECDEKIADRIPIKVLPRPEGEAPDVPKLRARIAEIQKSALLVTRKTAKAKGHDFDADGKTPLGYDLAAIGVIEEVRVIRKGADRALPTATTVVRVAFPAGEHLYFDPDDLVSVHGAGGTDVKPASGKAGAP